MYDWREDAVCREAGREPELWFPVGTAGPAVRQADEARAVCATCPVRVDCLAFALDAGAEFTVTGVWGGVWFDVARPDELDVLRTSVLQPVGTE